MNDNIELLNRIYSELTAKALKFEADLNSCGYESRFEWHTYRSADGEKTTEYPIPVFVLPNRGTVAFGMIHTVFDFAVTKTKLLKTNFEITARNYRMEIYIAEDDVQMIYSPEESTDVILGRVMMTVAEKFRISVYMPPFISVNELRELIAQLGLKGRTT